MHQEVMQLRTRHVWNRHCPVACILKFKIQNLYRRQLLLTYLSFVLYFANFYVDWFFFFVNYSKSPSSVIDIRAPF